MEQLSSATTVSDRLALIFSTSTEHSIALPQYVCHFCVLRLIAITALTRINYLMKILLVSGFVVAQCCALYFKLSASFRVYAAIDGLSTNFDARLYYVIILATVLVALIIINRQVRFQRTFLIFAFSVEPRNL